MKQQKTLQNNIKYYREKLGLSQEELSARCDYSSTYVGKIERGDRSPSLDTLVRIADALDVDLVRLFDPLETLRASPESLMNPDSASPYDLMIRRFNYLVGELNQDRTLRHLRHLPRNVAEQSVLPTDNQPLWETNQLSLSDRLCDTLKTTVKQAFQGKTTHINLIVNDQEPSVGVADGLVYPIQTEDREGTIGFEFFWPRILDDDQPQPLSETVFDCEPGERPETESS